ncbi:MAG TPA: methyltransferase [Microscillaceae bacterium]|jgi:2-polyprenyl-3-methyl-5-hydroxy-6-metoxy-1,4-benzoquinol methylase|nr:methyltransferase [Microscillaceae bacterium]
MPNDLETLEECPVCRHQVFLPWRQCQDHLVSQATFQLVACQSCGFIFTNPRPTESHIAAYYQSEQYQSHSQQKGGFFQKTYQWVRQKMQRRKLALVQTLAPQTGRLLDVGCGLGTFLRTCQQAGWAVEGIEPNPQAATIAHKETGAIIYSSIFDPAIAPSYEVISLWHVLEHVHRLEETMLTIKRLLHPKGVLLIAMPNVASQYEIELFQSYWAPFDVPRHLYHFSPVTFSKFLLNFQFKIESVEPLLWDSYYACLMSEKYSTSKFHWFKAAWRGYHSNQWAKRHQNNHSSLIYCIRNT